MTAQYQSGSVADRRRVVRQTRAIGGSDLNQRCAAGANDVRHPKGAADFDQLTTRNDHFQALGQHSDGEKYGARAVIDDSSVLRAGQFAQQSTDMISSRASSAGLKVDLDNGVICCNLGKRRNRFIRQLRAAEAGMKHHSRGIDGRAKRSRGAS